MRKPQVIPALLTLLGSVFGSPFAAPEPEIPPVPSAPGAGEAPEDRTFLPDSVLDLDGGPWIAFFQTGSDDVLALRVSIPLTEGPEEAGAGSLIRTLAEERMQSLASRVGARARATRTADALVYEAAGPAADLDFLVWVLSEGLQAPQAGRFEPVRRGALAEVSRRLETPQGVLAVQLRESLSPSTPPLLGTLSSLERMDASRLSAVWARSHRRDAARILVIGALPPEVVLASLTDLALPEAGPDPVLPPAAAESRPRLRPEVIRHWVGSAWPVPGGRDPRALVATRVISQALDSRPGTYEAGVELWELEGRWFLVLSGAAYPRDQQAMRARLDGLLAEARESLTDEEVRLHGARVRADLLESARTPWGLAEMVGQALDAGQEPAELEAMMAALGSMGAADLRAFFDATVAGAPVRQEVRP
jgi:predicted Zn-dependent peptidase